MIRDGFVFYRSFYEALCELPPEDFKVCALAIIEYGLDGKEPETELLRSMKMSGVANEDFDLISKMEHAGQEGYLSLPVRKTKTGYHKQSSILDTNQMLKLGTMVEEKM